MAEEKQIAEIKKTIDEALPQIWKVLTRDDAIALIGNKDEFNAGIRRAFEPYIKTKVARYFTVEWTRFYAEVFGLECDFTSIQVPVSRDGFGWLTIVDERVTTEAAFLKAAERFECWKYIDCSLDEVVLDSQVPTYARWFRDTVEADEVHKNKSAYRIRNQGANSITLRERILLEIWYEWKNPGQHLDIQNITLCAGSLTLGGGVPSCRWDVGEFRVDYFGPGSDRGRLRVREGVS